MRSRLIPILFLFTVPVLLQGQPFADYEEMRQQIGKMYQEKRYDEAADILEKALAAYPDHIEANAFNLAVMAVHLQQFDRAYDAFAYAHKKGVWFSLFLMEMPVFTPLKEHIRFETYFRNNETLRKKAEKKVRWDVLVEVPDGYTPAIHYPLFIALHGGADNVSTFRNVWRSSRLNGEFIVAYVQSSQMVSPNGFYWQDVDRTRKDVVKAYEKIIQEYRVDPSRIFIGGFSSGGYGALAILAGETLPASGFVTLCPGRPDCLDRETIEAMQSRGVRGVILTTEMDPNLQVQKEMHALMEELGLQVQLLVTPNIGHWYPEDFPDKLNDALSFLLMEQPAE